MAYRIKTTSVLPGFRIVEYEPAPGTQNVKFSIGDIVADADGSVHIILAYDPDTDRYASVNPSQFAITLDSANPFDLSLYDEWLEWTNGQSARMFFTKFAQIDKNLIPDKKTEIPSYIKSVGKIRL